MRKLLSGMFIMFVLICIYWEKTIGNPDFAYFVVHVLCPILFCSISVVLVLLGALDVLLGFDEKRRRR